MKFEIRNLILGERTPVFSFFKGKLFHSCIFSLSCPIAAGFPAFRFYLFLALINAAQPFHLSAQDMDPYQLVNEVKNHFQKVKNYEADVQIKVDVDFVKIPLREGKIYFRQPDKIKVKAKGFALLPKPGINFFPSSLLNEKYAAIYVKDERIDGVNTHMIKLIPTSDSSSIILSTLWIDPVRLIIRKIETTTKSEGTYKATVFFKPQPDAFDLPSQIIFYFDLKQEQLPIGLSGEFEADENKRKGKKNSKGTVTVSYLNYSVNGALDEKIFR
jgi:outer membrane lipoprotein-sorting protein